MRGRIAAVLVTVSLVAVAGCAKGPFADGEAAFNAGDYEAAKTAFEDAIAQGDSALQAHLYLARIYGLEGDYAGGSEQCREALRINPDHFHALIYEGVLIQLDGRAGSGHRKLEALTDRSRSNVMLIGSLLNAEQGLDESEKQRRLDLLRDGI